MNDLADTRLRLTGIWAASLVRGGRVLDASQLIGPSTKELVAAATELVVVTPKAAVVDAIGDLVDPRVKAYHTHLTDLPFESESFDAVVSLGIPNTDDLPSMTAEFCRVLKPETGLLILSMEVHPSEDTDRPNTDEEILRPLLDLRFRHVTTVTSSTYLSASFLSTDVPQPEQLSNALLVSSDRTIRDSCPHKLVIGSPLSLESYNLPGPILLPFEISELQQSLRELNSLVRDYEARSRAAEQVADDNARLLRELFAAEQVVAEEFDRRARREESTLLYSGSEQELAQIRQQLSEARMETDALRSTVSWRVTRPLRTVRRYLK